MGRPSVAAQRRREILDAFEHCVARQGLAATSLQDVADEAGLKRSILRHYVGNRDALVEALATHVAGRYRVRLESLVASLPVTAPASALLPLLFPAEAGESVGEILVVESLIAEGAENAPVRETMLGFVDHTLGVMRRLVRLERPDLGRADREAAAYGIVSLWFNHSSLTPLRTPPAHRRAALRAARSLLAP